MKNTLNFVYISYKNILFELEIYIKFSVMS